MDISRWNDTAVDNWDSCAEDIMQLIISMCNSNADKQREQLEHLAKWLKIDARLGNELFSVTDEYFKRKWLGKCCRIGRWQKIRIAVG